eukprot:CAMPEP_0116078018 /NCGR_PEP_ID=MMETSP0327-20121206/377_1 /TAXON_ID=44447 /ORGANISM="Pseudo-nitzschia delicatissima, Strain B596" /LENGTH=333 /DNA_ID=CAMNT_0003568533 /DNA_START=92 /DNA_END=1093 /DNA_ORIENTATION=+
MGDLEDRRLHLFCAQELNNSAAISFEKGQYEEATASLHNGLKLMIATNHHSCDENRNDCRNCFHRDKKHLLCKESCTIDGCIAFSEQTSFLIHGNNSIISNDNKSRSDDVNKNTNVRNNAANNRASKKRRLSCSSDVANGFPTKIVANNKCGDGYVYQRPVRVPLEGFCQCNKGYTSLLVVIVFNLAVAHHRSAINEGSYDAAKAENVAFMYKLCLRLLHQAAVLSSPQQLSMEIIASSIRCEMLIHNNLSQLYKIGGNNPFRHQQSLQDLLSTLMVVIERGTREDTNNISNNWWDATRLGSTQGNGEVLDVVEGVLQNLDPLILNRQCADAA